MGELIGDDQLDAFAVAGDGEQVAAGLQTRYGDVIDRISLYTPYEPDPEQVRIAAGALRSAG